MKRKSLSATLNWSCFAPRFRALSKNTNHTFSCILKKAGMQLFVLSLLFLPFSAMGQSNLLPNVTDCGVSRPPFDFNVQNGWTSNSGMKISAVSTPLVGDIDGDGVVEILAAGADGQSIYIIDGKTGNCQTTTIPAVAFPGDGGAANIALCRIDGNVAIFNDGGTGWLDLFVVTSAPGERPITFRRKWGVWSGSAPQGGAMPVVTDFDGDGIAEFVSGGRIIDSQNGTILATLPYVSVSSFSNSFHLAVDLDNDGLPEVVAGTEVYKFSRYTTPKLQLWKSLSNVAGGTTSQDGLSMAGDINQDGNVDLVFIHAFTSAVMYIWTPLTNSLIGSITVPGPGASSYPFIGDIDGVVSPGGKKYPEICVNRIGKLYAYTFDGTSFSQKWTLDHTVRLNGSTAVTLFDFNNDGVVELIFRDHGYIRIFDGSGSDPVEKFRQFCGSAGCDETPVVADVNGDGGADIIVSGHPRNAGSIVGEIMMFQGGTDKWVSCPSVWNQQLYSPLYVNADLSIPRYIQPVNITFTRPDNSTVQPYNGGPMQVPYLSGGTFFPSDLAPDIYVVSGSLVMTSSTSVKLTVVFANQGQAVASANTPIQYYKNAIIYGNNIGTATLGVDLAPGQTREIIKEITISGQMPNQFYVRIMDDGVAFPAAGAFNDCDLTNNTKVFSTLELTMTADALNSCVDGVSTFHIRIANNTNLDASNVILTDSLGTGWEYISGTTTDGSLGTFDQATGKIGWSIPLIASGSAVNLTIMAKALTAGTIRNTAWIESIDGTVIGRESIEEYVIVSGSQAPAAAMITPDVSSLCPGNSVLLSSSVTGASSYQWYRNGVEIVGATQETYLATTTGNYKVTYLDGACVSQISSAAIVTNNGCGVPVDITVFLQGPMTSNGTMTNYIQQPVEKFCVFTAPRLPVTDPYGTGAVYYNINDAGGPAGAVVDWVKIEIRSTADPKTVLETQALLLKPNGQVVDTLGSVPLFSSQTIPVYLVVRHRNHLSVVSNSITSFSGTVTYDFSSYLSNGHKNLVDDPDPMTLSNDKWCVWAGDSYKSGTGEMVNNQDHSIVISSSTAGDRDAYLAGDFNMDGVINSIDISIVESSINAGVFSPVLIWEN